MSIKAKYNTNALGTKCSEERKIKIGNANRGRKMTPEQNKANSERGKGKKRSEETKKKQSESLKKVIHIKIECPYCFKIGDTSGMKHWHFDNCLQNTNLTLEQIKIIKEKHCVSEETKEKIANTLILFNKQKPKDEL